MTLFLLWSFSPAHAANPHTGLRVKDGRCAAILNDYSRSNRYAIRSFETPKTEADFIRIIKNSAGPISVLGGGFSMGGQIANKGGVIVDTSQYNSILAVDKSAKTVRVQAGATWRQIQQAIFRDGFAVKVMQTYNNFTVGGSLSVNVHGRYVGFGPIISTVRNIRLLLADGTVVNASRTENSELFYGAIGGYGALGVILEATLDLADNVNLERRWLEFRHADGDIAHTAQDYIQYFHSDIAGKESAVLSNADIYPPDYNMIRAISYFPTNKPLTIEEHLQEPVDSTWARLYNATLHTLEQFFVAVKRYRSQYFEPKILNEDRVVTRNWEAGYDVSELSPLSEQFPVLRRIFGFSNRKSLLQEYFIPQEKLPAFLKEMKAVFLKYGVNVTNVSLRHVPQNTESTLAWSRHDSFAVVIYYTQLYGLTENAQAANLRQARAWTQEMLDRVLDTGGSYYLPYQLYARTDQFRRAYPHFATFQALKAKVDPQNKFSNYFVDAYISSRESFHFREMLSSQIEQIDMLDFFHNVFGIIDPEDHMRAIREAYRQLTASQIEPNDKNMYEALQRLLPMYAGGVVSKTARSIVSLRTQQVEIARETEQLLSATGKTRFNGYVEVGSTGRYVGYLKGSSGLTISGPTYVVSDNAPALFSPVDMLERTGGYGGFDPRSYAPALWRSQYVDLNDYDMIAQAEIPNQSVDLVSIYIGLHHIPPHKIRPFLASIYRVLRPGGVLVLRDHDANSEAILRMDHLAHDTFNAGLGVPFDVELREIRNFQPLAYWIDVLKDTGFKLSSANPILQKGDPTRNTLIAFEKVQPVNSSAFAMATQLDFDSGDGTLVPLNSLSEYHRSSSHTFLVGPEWFFVDFAKEYADFQARYPWYLFPFDDYMKLAKQIYEAQVAYAERHGIDDKKAFEAYVKMDRGLIQANGVLYWALQKVAQLTKWSLRKQTPPQTTGFVVQGISQAQVDQFSAGLIKGFEILKDDMTLLATQRQMPFTQAMIELAEHEDVKLIEVAGNTDISVLFASSADAIDDYAKALSTFDLIFMYKYPTDVSTLGTNMHLFSAKIHVSELGALIRKIKLHGDRLVRVHDY
jgi:FAD/FMN-containing dehydrogenase/SAM-dependent methyltransferase